MAIEFKLPELGEGVDSADVSRIFVSEGDEISADQNVLELETEKAVADLPCPQAGKISKIHVSEGETVEIGQVLLTIEEVEAANTKQPPTPEDETGTDESVRQQDEQDAEEQSAEEAEPGEQERAGEEQADEEQAVEEQADEEQARVEDVAAETSETATARPAKRNGDGRKHKRGAERASERGQIKQQQPRSVPPPAGPATRRLARKLEVDLHELDPGEGGRIRQEDIVRAYVEGGSVEALRRQKLPDFTQFGPVEREPLNKIARTAAQRLTMSWRRVPHVTQHGLADITELEAARREFVQAADPSQPKVTLTALTVKAVVGVLKQLPKFNASLDARHDELVLKRFFHIGLAVDTPHGLLVPVIRNADQKPLLEIAVAIQQLARRARERTLEPQDLQGASFTISNQGGIGGGHFTPIVNWPQVAILGLGRADERCEMWDGVPQQRLRLPLSLSYDHRVINGAEAARFMTLLEESLSGTFELLIMT